MFGKPTKIENFNILNNKYIPQMFKKLIVIDAKGHLLGRLASYVAKALLSGMPTFIQDKELQLLDAKVSISPDHSSGTKSNSHNS